MNIKVIGYYGHSNAGDEQYKLTFIYLFENYLNTPNYNVQFIDCDKLVDFSCNDEDIIILGGGDILNNYFMDKVIAKFRDKPNKIIAVSIGLPYDDILTKTDKLQIIDFIFIRTEQDVKLFQKYFHPERIHYLPDLSFFLTKKSMRTLPTLYKNDCYTELVKKLESVNKKIACFSLNRHIYHPCHVEQYQSIIHEFAKVVVNLVSQDYYVVFLPFNTVQYDKIENNCENDVIMHNDVIVNALFYQRELNDNSNYLYGSTNNKTVENNTLNIDCTLTPAEMFSLYDRFHLTVTMRFHATLFSIYNHVPMVPVYTTKKIRNFLIDVKLEEYGYELTRNDNDLPLFMSSQHLMKQIDLLCLPENDVFRNMMIKQMKFVCKRMFSPAMKKSVSELLCVMKTPYPKTIFTNVMKPSADEIVDKTRDALNIYSQKREGEDDFRRVKKRHNQEQIVKLTNFHLTSKLNTPYTYGIQSKTFHDDYNYREEWKWIVEDFRKNNASMLNVPFGLYNLTYIDQIDTSHAHRSGWQYVYEHVKLYHNEHSKLLLDLYLDRTFHWEKETYKNLGIVPYKKNWVGFIHHTFEKSFSDYNDYTLLEDADFIESLKCCKGLIVLSEHLKTRFLQEFAKMGDDFVTPPIFSLVHPTETDIFPTFTINNFYNNEYKKIIHVGGWLRNIFSFYNCVIPETIDLRMKRGGCGLMRGFYKTPRPELEKLQKATLKGQSMNNYYPCENFMEDLKEMLSSHETREKETENIKKCSQNQNENLDNTGVIVNNWHKHFYEHVQKMIDEVKVIDKISNEDYDLMLSKNVVFLHLVEPSAVNTVIECIVRNTPVIVNRHPAVVELLGEEYPMYYEDDESDENIIDIYNLINFATICKTHKYLKHMKKDRFHIDYFMREFLTVIKTICG